MPVYNADARHLAKVKASLKAMFPMLVPMDEKLLPHMLVVVFQNYSLEPDEMQGIARWFTSRRTKLKGRAFPEAAIQKAQSAMRAAIKQYESREKRRSRKVAKQEEQQAIAAILTGLEKDVLKLPLI